MIVAAALLALALVGRCSAAWVNMRLDADWTCRKIYHPAQAQVLIVVEVLDHNLDEGRREVQLQIRFPQSAAIAAECESRLSIGTVVVLLQASPARHGDTDNNFAHREIFFAATREGDYSYCMRDVPVEVAVADLVTGHAPADSLTDEQLAGASGGARPSRRARIDVRSRFVAAPKDAVVECFATTASDCDLPAAKKHEL